MLPAPFRLTSMQGWLISVKRMELDSSLIHLVPPLRDLIGKRMFLVKPNHHELGELFDTTISSIEDIVSYARKLHETGIENVIVSMGGEGAIL